MMGLDPAALLPGTEIAGVATFLEATMRRPDHFALIVEA